MLLTIDADAFLADWVALASDIASGGYQAFKGSLDDAAKASDQYHYKNRTGHLSDSRETMAWSMGGFQWRGEIKWMATYGKFVDESTKAHPIVATRAKMLRFYDKGGNVQFRKRVMHPGTMGAGFSEHARQWLNVKSPQEIQSAVDSAVARHP